MIGLLAMAAAITASDGSTLGVFENGNTLLADCQGNTAEQISCLGYITGFVDGFQAMETYTQVPVFCVPRAVVVQQLRDIAVKSLVDHPETRQNSASLLIGKAFKDAFPCSK